ncbi:MAG: hypothetical protein ABIZ80_15660 [Bryobacteraceae bacterium]
MAGLSKNSGRFLAILVCFQLILHTSRAKMGGELAKTVLLIDLIDALIGLFVPEWILKQPVVRVLRGMNPAQCTDYIVQNMCWLVYCGTLAAYQRGWGEFNSGDLHFSREGLRQHHERYSAGLRLHVLYLRGESAEPGRLQSRESGELLRRPKGCDGL